jgi:glycine/D-amino acid oxidase-like deaminating enzyme
MVAHPDFIVVGGGLTGVCLSYELVRQGASVLLLEQHAALQGATRFSYGGIAYWAGTTDLTRQLGQAGIERYRSLSDELEFDVQFQEWDLILTIPTQADPQAIAKTYASCAISPQLISVAEACELEPLLNPPNLAAALTVRHGQVCPERTVEAFQQAFLRLGGQYQVASVQTLVQQGDRIIGVQSQEGHFFASGQVIICAGAWSRFLLKSAGYPVPLYFTHAEILETSPTDLRLRSRVMPAIAERFRLEASASKPELNSRWEEPDQELVPAIVDAGAFQFQNGRLRLGQISRAVTNPQAKLDPVHSEQVLREQVGKVLPALAQLPAQWCHCLVAFSSDGLPLIGAVPAATSGLFLFSGFSNPFVLVPPLAQRFAQMLISTIDDPLLTHMTPTRFEFLKN